MLFTTVWSVADQSGDAFEFHRLLSVPSQVHPVVVEDFLRLDLVRVRARCPNLWAVKPFETVPVGIKACTNTEDCN